MNGVDIHMRHDCETSDVTPKKTLQWPHVHPRNAILGHSLYDLGQEAGNYVFYALACSYLIFYSSVVLVNKY